MKVGVAVGCRLRQHHCTYDEWVFSLDGGELGKIGEGVRARKQAIRDHVRQVAPTVN